MRSRHPVIDVLQGDDQAIARAEHREPAQSGATVTRRRLQKLFDGLPTTTKRGNGLISSQVAHDAQIAEAG
jgi:hypothetical protein